MTFLLVLSWVPYGEALNSKDGNTNGVITISPIFVELAEIVTCKEKQKTLGSNMGVPNMFLAPGAI